MTLIIILALKKNFQQTEHICFLQRSVIYERGGLLLFINIWLAGWQEHGDSDSMSWLEPSASQQEEDLSVWELPADGQHLEGDVRVRLRSLRRFVINCSVIKDASQ